MAQAEHAQFRDVIYIHVHIANEFFHHFHLLVGCRNDQRIAAIICDSGHFRRGHATVLAATAATAAIAAATVTTTAEAREATTEARKAAETVAAAARIGFKELLDDLRHLRGIGIGQREDTHCRSADTCGIERFYQLHHTANVGLGVSND